MGVRMTKTVFCSVGYILLLSNPKQSVAASLEGMRESVKAEHFHYSIPKQL